MRISSGYIYIILLALLAVLIWGLSENTTSTTEYESRTADTLFLYKTDTIIEYRTRYITKRTTDTLYIPIEKDTDTLKLPIVQKQYAKDSVYDLWISGVEPLAMDSLKIYPKTEYRYITNTITREIYPKRTEIYFFGGLSSIYGTLNPKIGISIKTKKEWLISPEIGLYDNKAMYGLTIGKRIK